MTVRTNIDLITKALRLAGVVANDEPPTAEQEVAARDSLEMMLQSWQNNGPHIWLKTSQTVALVANQREYTLDPVRPVQVLSVRMNNGSSETPMHQMTRAQYDAIPVKTSQGIPTAWYYDKQREAARLYVWPVMASVNSETLSLTYIRETSEATTSGEADVPGEWYETVVYNLADRLIDEYNTIRPRVSQRAAMLLDDAMAFDREDSMFFSGLSAT